MPTSSRQNLIAAFMVFLAMAPASCASIPPTNYYVLGFSDASQIADRDHVFPHTLAVANFDSKPLYIRKKIIWRSESNQVGYYSYEKWAALPAEMLSYRLFARANESRLFNRVIMGAAAIDADFVLTGTILSFEELAAPEGLFGKVEVKAELLRRDGTVLWTDIAGHAEPVTGQKMEDTVGAIATAAEKTITEILSSVEQIVRNLHSGHLPPHTPAAASR